MLGQEGKASTVFSANVIATNTATAALAAAQVFLEIVGGLPRLVVSLVEYGN